MKYFLIFSLAFLSGCAWLQSHPEAEKELEQVGEEVIKDAIEIGEKELQSCCESKPPIPPSSIDFLEGREIAKCKCF